jgi:hypothetical protein
MASTTQPFVLQPGDVIVSGETRIELTEAVVLKGTEREKRLVREPTTISLDCPNYCGGEAREDGKAYSVRMGRRSFDQWGAPYCGRCKARLVRRDV